MRGLKHVILMSLALGMLFYSLPQLDIQFEFSLPTIFAIAWICMALLVVAAHLHEILGVDNDARSHTKLEPTSQTPLKGDHQG